MRHRIRSLIVLNHTLFHRLHNVTFFNTIIKTINITYFSKTIIKQKDNKEKKKNKILFVDNKKDTMKCMK
mgnify:CR=1 FL=1